MRSLGLGGGGPLGAALTKTSSGAPAINTVAEVKTYTEIQGSRYVTSAPATITINSSVDIIGDASNKYASISVNGGSDIVDAARLLAGYPNVQPLPMDESAVVTIEGASITRVALAIISSAVIPPAGCVNQATSTVASLTDTTATESFYVFFFAAATKVEIAFVKHGATGGTFSVRAYT